MNPKAGWLCAAGVWMLTGAMSSTGGAEPIGPLPLRDVQLADGFWRDRLTVYRQHTIPHSWAYMGWEIRALRKANGMPFEGDLNGTWGEATLHKLLETIAYAQAIEPEAQLKTRADEIIRLLAGAQQPDGYLHAYITNNGKTPWDPATLAGAHEGYVLGHMIEAAVEYHATTGDRTFLDIAVKAADRAWDRFLGPRGRPGFCEHAELEMALVELYRATGEQRYLELARAFVEWRGRDVLLKSPGAYSQDHLPLREQKALQGHAVRAVFFATGVADLALVAGDADYHAAARRFFNNLTTRRMNIAGGIGPRRKNEALGDDFELPDDGYYESCSACGLADFAHRMSMLERAAAPADVLERVIYNAVLHGISLDGTSSYYANPLSDRNNPRYNSWVCCPPNLSRTLFQIGRYAFSRTDRDFYVNLFIAADCRFPLDDIEATLAVRTDYPWDGRVTIEVRLDKPARFAMHLRIPQWCPQAGIVLNGMSPRRAPADNQGYVRLDRTWRPGDRVELTLAMPVQVIEAHPRLIDCHGKVALRRGPLIYGFEGLDNAGSAQITLAPDASFTVEHRPDLLGGVTVIRTTTHDNTPCTAIPFFALANRDKSTQEVWVATPEIQSDRGDWADQLYRVRSTQP